MIADKPIREIMSTQIAMMDEQTMLHEAIGSMAKANIGALIVTQGGKPAGIFTERDLLKRVVAKGCGCSAEHLGHRDDPQDYYRAT